MPTDKHPTKYSRV